MSNIKKLTYEFVKEQFAEHGYELLETQYLSNGARMRYLCSKHGEQSITYGGFSQGHGCPICGKEENARKKLMPFDKLRKLFEDAGYELLEVESAKSNVPLRYLCHTHGEQRISYNNLQNGKRCPECSNGSKAKPMFDTVKSLFNENGYTLLSTEYVNSRESLRYACPIHGEQQITYTSFQQGTRCPQCNTSKGEKSIQEYLDSHNITYATQYTFEDLVCKGKLRFDFCIFGDDSKTIKLLIEFQGQQHYHAVDFAGKGEDWAKSRLVEQQAKDQLKVDYCKLHSIPLLTIKYSEFSLLEDILSREVITYA